MTVAVCIRCGGMKTGAFTRCPGCGLVPERAEDLAKSVLLSDQSCDRAALDDASQKLGSGGLVEFDEAAIRSWVEASESSSHNQRMPVGCMILWYAPLVIMIFLFLALGALLAYVKGWFA